MRLAAAALIAALAAPVPAQEVEPPRLSVTGVGSVVAAPDLATVQLAVSVRAADAATAFAGAAEQARAVFAAVRATGVPPSDMQTASLTLGPVYAGGGDQPLRIDGYAARQSLGVTVRALDGLGPLLDAVAKVGATEIEGVSFDVADRRALRDAARRAAMQDAAEAAALLADAAGVTLGRPVAIALGGEGGGPHPMMRAAVADEAMPVAAGELTVTATVSVSYAIQ